MRPALISAFRFPFFAFPLLLLPSCANPFAPIDADYDRHLAAAPDRLHSIYRFDGDRFARPAAPPSATPAEPAAPPPSRLLGLQTLSLSIEQARAAALSSNLDIKVALVTPAIDAERLRAEEAKFEAVFRPNASYYVSDQPTLDRTASNTGEGWRGGAGVSVPLRTGGRANIDFTQNYNESGNPFLTFNSSYSSDLTFDISQPLLRGAGRRANTYSIRIAEFNRQLGEAATKLEVIRQLANVDRAYWVLDALKRELDVRLKELEFAQADLAQAQRKVAAGAAPEIDVVRAQSAAASKLTAIIDAENNVLQQQRELKRLMNIPELPLESSTLVECTSAPDPIAYTFDRDTLERDALTNRMEMLELELRLAQDFSSIEYAKNQALPSFVLDFRYGADGLGPTLSESARVLRRNNFESWTASITGEIPIGNEAAKARVREAILARLQRLSTRDARNRAISQEVYSAIDKVESNWQQINANTQSVTYQQRLYNAERHKLEVGGGTNIDVLNALTNLANAQTILIRARANYQLALVDLAFATGTLLGAERIDWSPLDESGKPGADPTPPAFPLYADPVKAAVVPAEGRPKEEGMGR